MNALKPRKGFVQDELNIERLTPIQWDGIMRAMQNYAKHYHETMQANDFEKPQEQCTIPVVVGRSEQLTAFAEYCDEEHGLFIPSWMIDGYNKSR